MNGRTYDDRQARRVARAASGYTSLRITRGTRRLLDDLQQLIPPFEIRGLDELVSELAGAEIARRRPSA